MENDAVIHSPEFEVWWGDAMVIAICENFAPDEYVWHWDAPGVWLEKFNAGLSPRDAVMSVFCVH